MKDSYSGYNIVLPKLEDNQPLSDIDNYIKLKGFNSYKKAINLSKDGVIEEVKKSKLRGRGGACFPTGLKWSFMPKIPDSPTYLCVNCDESEPGSFKDRQIVEFNPFQLIEGIMISGYCMDISKAFIYIRGEYHKWAEIMRAAINAAKERNILNADTIDIVVHEGAGAYICGEETSLMNSIEGDRPYPRIKPPFPAQNGLWGCPTTINNVETIAAVPWIIENGGEAFSKVGAEAQPGTILYGVSGNVNKPGVYELATGIPLRELIYDVCGGIPNDKKIKAVIPGGSSMPPLDASELDVCMDEGSLSKIGSHIGTAGVMVIDEDADIVDLTQRIAHFYHHESCGQCTPCREGCGWIEKILKRINAGEGVSSDIDLMLDICDNIEGNTVCALGDAMAWPVRGFIQKFRSEFEAKVNHEVIAPAKNITHGKRSQVLMEVRK